MDYVAALMALATLFYELILPTQRGSDMTDEPQTEQTEQTEQTGADWDAILGSETPQIDLSALNQRDVLDLLENRVSDDEVFRIAGELDDHTTDITSARLTVARYLRIFQRLGNFALRIGAAS